MFAILRNLRYRAPRLFYNLRYDFSMTFCLLMKKNIAPVVSEGCILYICTSTNIATDNINMDTKKLFDLRRTVRHFSDRDVSDGLLDSILERAMRAPTCGNMQLYSVVVNRKSAERRELEKLHFDQPAATGCPVMLTVCADYGRFTRWCRLSDADPGYDNFLSFMNCMTDAVIYAQQIVTIAESEGLGTCYLGTVVYNARQISDMLSLPELVVPVACIALGYPAGEGEASERLPLAAVRHDGSYRNDSDSRIMELFRAKDDYPANAVYVEENGKRNLAQVFTDVRYPRSLNEAVSQQLVDLLRDKRFIK